MRGSYPLAIAVSLLLHGALIVLLVYGWEATSERELKPMPQVVQAKLVTLEPKVTKKKTPPPKVDLEQKRRQRELDRQRRAQEVKKPRAVEKKPERDEAKKTEDELKKQEDQARAEKERQEQLDRERQSAFEEALEEEEELLDASEDTQAVMSVAQAIRTRIESVWSRPPSARNGMLTVAQINFVPTGRVVAANIVEGSGNAALDRSVLTAIRKVEVFPEVAELARREPALFEREVRTTLLNFRVEDLRQ
ncbi:TonB family protein [Microbulbifer sp. TYP-18]|uniref:TonB family protein n=1 Tax=Microbulbifer sp. TYP-18 TaxID=3230024 RepID=UPI0034C6A4CA